MQGQADLPESLLVESPFDSWRERYRAQKDQPPWARPKESLGLAADDDLNSLEAAINGAPSRRDALDFDGLGACDCPGGVHR